MRRDEIFFTINHLAHFQLIPRIDRYLGIFCESALRWISQELTDDWSTLVQVMVWYRQAPHHCLSQYWPSSMLSYDVTKPLCVNWVNDRYPWFNDIYITLSGSSLKCYSCNSTDTIGTDECKQNVVQCAVDAKFPENRCLKTIARTHDSKMDISEYQCGYNVQ